MRTYDPKKHMVSGWLASIKYNGIACRWTGQLLRSRNGNIFDAPKSFTDMLPQGIPFDGELYIPYAGFELIRSTVQHGGDWSAVRIMVYDAPGTGGFSERLRPIGAELAGNPVASLVDQLPCAGHDHAQRLFEQVTAAGGEGIVLRDPCGLYDRFAGAGTLKYKRHQDDEATVLSMMGNRLRCTWRGITITLGGSIAAHIREALQPGSRITFRYDSITDRGLPFQPRFVTVRDYE